MGTKRLSAFSARVAAILACAALLVSAAGYAGASGDGAARESRLMNLREWLSARAGEEVEANLDVLIDSKVIAYYDGDFACDALLSPSRWPSAWLEGRIPEYGGVGWLYDLAVFRPTMSYRSEDLAQIDVTICEYDPEELDAYVAALLDGGFAESEPSAEYTGLEGIDGVRAFEGERCDVVIYTTRIYPSIYIAESREEYERAMESGLPGTVLSVYPRAGEAPARERTPDEETRLLNVFDWATELNMIGIPPMDAADEPEIDALGRRTTAIEYPSEWPAGIFGDLIPPYRYPGVMTHSLVTAPDANPAPDRTLIATLFLAYTTTADFDAYARELVNFGYRELEIGEYDEAEIEQSEYFNEYQILILPSIRVYLACFADMDYLSTSICMRFDGRYMEFFGITR